MLRAALGALFSASSALLPLHLQRATSDVFRSAATRKDCVPSPAMAIALDYMRRGGLVPDSTVLDMVRERAAFVVKAASFLMASRALSLKP